jgi:hypothetical protein
MIGVRTTRNSVLRARIDECRYAQKNLACSSSQSPCFHLLSVISYHNIRVLVARDWDKDNSAGSLMAPWLAEEGGGTPTKKASKIELPSSRGK